MLNSVDLGGNLEVAVIEWNGGIDQSFMYPKSVKTEEGLAPNVPFAANSSATQILEGPELH